MSAKQKACCDALGAAIERGYIEENLLRQDQSFVRSATKRQPLLCINYCPWCGAAQPSIMEGLGRLSRLESLKATFQAAEGMAEALANAYTVMGRYQDSCNCDPCDGCDQLPSECEGSECSESCECIQCPGCVVSEAQGEIAEALGNWKESRLCK